MSASMNRREFLVVGAGGLAVLAGCANGTSVGPSAVPSTVGAGDPPVLRAEDARRVTGASTVSFALAAVPLTLDLGGRTVETWGYDGVVPGRVLRVREGDTLEVALDNDLPEDTSIHWHGLALRNDMDGVPSLTQAPIRPGESFTYRFIASHSGTYWFHPHMGLQLDRGLYAPLVVESRDEPGGYDADEVVVLDDWLDGMGTTPEQTFQGLTSMGSMSGMDHGGMGMSGMSGMGGGSGGGSSSGMAGMGMFTSPLLGGDTGDVGYPLHLLNGRPDNDRSTITVPPGGRVRLRIINAGSDTAYRVAVGGHRMTVTHTDGFPVEPVVTDAVLVGMGERYDVTVTVSPGAWPLTALAEGKAAVVSAVLRTNGSGATPAPPVGVRPAELDGRLLTYSDLRATDRVRLAERDLDVVHRVQIAGSMMPYQWSFDGQPFGEHAPLFVEQGQRVRLTFKNDSAMWHPIHLHGHTFRVGGEVSGPRKDTVNVLPQEELSVDFDADNPGQWMLHCHNTYHLERGMAAVVAYTTDA